MVAGTWEYDASTSECTVTLRQTQDAPPFEVAVDVAIDTEPQRTTTVFMRDGAGQARVTCAEAPSSVTLDPQTRLLGEFSMERSD